MMDFLARSASCPSVTCSHPVGVTLGKSLFSSEARLFCLYLSFQERVKAKSHMCFEKPRLWWLLETHVASQWYRGSGLYCADASAEAVVASAEPSAEPAAVTSADAAPSAEPLGLTTEPAKQTQYPEHDAPYAKCRPGSAPQSGQPPVYPGT